MLAARISAMPEAQRRKLAGSGTTVAVGLIVAAAEPLGAPVPVWIIAVGIALVLLGGCLSLALWPTAELAPVAADHRPPADEPVSLADEGDALADAITEFKTERELTSPVWPDWPGPEQPRDFWYQQQRSYDEATKSFFRGRFVGPVERYVAEARAAGFALNPETDGMAGAALEDVYFLAGAKPVEAIAQALRELASRVRSGQASPTPEQMRRALRDVEDELAGTNRHALVALIERRRTDMPRATWQWSKHLPLLSNALPAEAYAAGSEAHTALRNLIDELGLEGRNKRLRRRELNRVRGVVPVVDAAVMALRQAQP